MKFSSVIFTIACTLLGAVLPFAISPAVFAGLGAESGQVTSAVLAVYRESVLLQVTLFGYCMLLAGMYAESIHALFKDSRVYFPCFDSTCFWMQDDRLRSVLWRATAGGALAFAARLALPGTKVLNTENALQLGLTLFALVVFVAMFSVICYVLIRQTRTHIRLREFDKAKGYSA